MTDRMQQIDDYIFGRLSGQDKSDFKAEMDLDTDLKDQVRHALLAREVGEELSRLELREWMAKFEEDQSGQDRIPVPFIRMLSKRHWQMAAVLMVLVCIAIWIWTNQKGGANLEPIVQSESLPRPVDSLESQGDVFVEHEMSEDESRFEINKGDEEGFLIVQQPLLASAEAYYAYTEIPTGIIRSEASEVKEIPPVQQAYLAIQAKRYNDARNILDAIRPEAPEYGDALLLLADVSMRQHKYTSARQYLELLKTAGLASRDLLEWNLVVVNCLDPEADPSLTELAIDGIVEDPAHTFHDQAAKIKSQLQKQSSGLKGSDGKR